MSEDGFDFGAEEQQIAVKSIVERLYPQPIASQEQDPFGAVPDREGKHSAQMFDALPPIFLVEMNDSFGVAPSSILMAAGLEILAQSLVVIDFAIEDDPNTAFFIA